MGRQHKQPGGHSLLRGLESVPSDSSCRPHSIRRVSPLQCIGYSVFRHHRAQVRFGTRCHPRLGAQDLRRRELPLPRLSQQTDIARHFGLNFRACPHFSSGGEAKCMRGLSVRGARRLTSGDVLSLSVEHGEQAQRSNGGPLMCLARQPVRNAGLPPSLGRRPLADHGCIFPPRSFRSLPLVGAAFAAGLFDQIQVADFD